MMMMTIETNATREEIIRNHITKTILIILQLLKLKKPLKEITCPPVYSEYRPNQFHLTSCRLTGEQGQSTSQHFERDQPRGLVVRVSDY